MNSVPCLLSHRYYYNSPNTWWVCVWVTGRAEQHHALLGHRCPWKETTKGATNSSWDADSSQSENALCCSTSKSHSILDTFVPFPPLTSPILTHHLNKEVRAMIKSSHSVNQVARQMSDPTLSETHLCVRQPPPVLSVTSSLQSSADVACQWWS